MREVGAPRWHRGSAGAGAGLAGAFRDGGVFRLDERALYWPAGFPAGPFRTLETAPQRLPAGDAGAVAGCGRVSPAQRSAGRQCVRTAGAGGRHPQAGRAAGIGDKPRISWTRHRHEANLAWLNPWITVRRGGGPPPQREADAAFKTRAAPGEGLAAGGGGLFACGARNRARTTPFARHRARFDAALGALHDGLGKKNHTKRLDKVRSVGRLRERYRRGSDIEVQPGAKGLAADFRCKPSMTGTRCTTPAPEAMRCAPAMPLTETVVRQYCDLEATFRSLKSEMGLRPTGTASPRGRMTRCERRPPAGPGWRRTIRDSWWTIRNKLAGWVRIALQSAEGGRIVIGPARRRSPRWRPWPAAGGLAALCADAGCQQDPRQNRGALCCSRLASGERQNGEDGCCPPKPTLRRRR